MTDTSKKRRSGKACVIGAGPNGLAAAIVLAQAGMRVEVYEAEATIGGAARTLELTLPGFRHDFGSAVHPMAAGSPFFSSLPLHTSLASGGSLRRRRWRIRWTADERWCWNASSMRLRWATTAARGGG